MKCGTVVISSQAIAFPDCDEGGGGGSCRAENQQNVGGTKLRGRNTSNRVCSAIVLWKPIPTPSITASSRAHTIAPFRAALNPPRMANEPPVRKPAMTVRVLSVTILHSIWHHNSN